MAQAPASRPEMARQLAWRPMLPVLLLAPALMLIVCIAVGLACTLMIVKNGLL